MNVGSGAQNVAGGDLNIGHRVAADPDAAAELDALRELLTGLPLTPRSSPPPRPSSTRSPTPATASEAGGRLESFVDQVKRAGALAEAGSSFVGAVTRLAAWIGPLAAGAAALLT